MHYRLFQDVELGLGSWRTRDDFLGSLTVAQKKLAPLSTRNLNHDNISVANGSPNPDPKASASRAFSPHEQAPAVAGGHRSYPKRVSFTQDERRIMMGSAAPLVEEGDAVEATKKPEQENSLQVAEILRQMSQGSGVAQKRESMSSQTRDDDEDEDKHDGLQAAAQAAAAMAALGKRKDPPPLPIQPKGGMASTKRARWHPSAIVAFLPPDGSHGVAIERKTANIAPAVRRRFFNVMEVGPAGPRRSAKNHSNRLIVPPLRPIQGLHLYDVLFGQELVSHLNTGNRRFLVLAYGHLKTFKTGTIDVRSQIAKALYGEVQSAGGRFLCLDRDTGSFKESDKSTALTLIAGIIKRQVQLSAKSLLSIFRHSCKIIWEDSSSEPSPNAASASNLQPQSGPLTIPSVDIAKRPVSMEPLKAGFQPGPFDIICSRGRRAKEHAGNKSFISLIKEYLPRYTEATGKLAKSAIVSEVLDTIRRRSPNGGFVKLNKYSVWCDTGDHLSREKIGQSFRDRLHTRYSSSSKAKQYKRREKTIASRRKYEIMIGGEPVPFFEDNEQSAEPSTTPKEQDNYYSDGDEDDEALK